MKNRIGFIMGFVIGLIGFLFIFKVSVLDRTPPEDELAPGIVVIVAIFSGVFFAFVGNAVQQHFKGGN